MMRNAAVISARSFRGEKLVKADYEALGKSICAEIDPSTIPKFEKLRSNRSLLLLGFTSGF